MAIELSETGEVARFAVQLEAATLEMLNKLLSRPAEETLASCPRDYLAVLLLASHVLPRLQGRCQEADAQERLWELFDGLKVLMTEAQTAAAGVNSKAR